jgi:hypothetical protein
MVEKVQTPQEPVIDPTPQEPVVSQDILNDDGRFSESYLSSLPDDLGKHGIFEKYNNPVDLVKGAINAQSLAGKKAEEFWTSEDPDVIASRNQIMGIPDSADGYEYNTEGIPDSHIEMATKQANAFKEFAAENKIPKEIAEKILEWDKQRGIEAFEQNKATESIHIQNVENQLREIWKGDKYEYNISKIKGTLEAAGLESFVNDPAIANNPQHLQLILDKMVPLFEDDKIIEGRMQQNHATLSDQLADLESKMYSWDGSTNDHQYINMVKQRTELLTKITNSKKSLDT